MLGIGKKIKAKKSGERLNEKDQQAVKQFQEGVVKLKDLLAPAAFNVTSKYVEIDGKYATTLFVLTYPRYLEVNWLSPIINFDIEFDLGMFIYPQDSAVILKQLKRQVTRVAASILMKTEKGKVRDPQLETAYRDIEELRDRLVQGTERFFQYSLYMTLYADTEEELDEVVSQVEVILEGRLVYVKPAIFQMQNGFISTLPLGQDKLVRSTNMSSSSLSTVFPFVSSDLTSDNGILYGINLHNNSLILFDRFSLANANLVIFAKSGAGKSIRGSEPVLVREGDKIRLRPIKEVVDNLIQERGINYTDDELEGVAYPGIEVYSFNKEMKGAWSPVTVAARKDSPEKFYRFKTRSGREITTTGDHNMLVLRNGKVEVVKSTEVKQGEYVPLPRRVEVPEGQVAPVINLVEVLRRCPRGIYVEGAQGIINDHYQEIKGMVIDGKLDRYLYKYRQGTLIPLEYFWKMIEALDLRPEDIEFEKLSVRARNSGQNNGISAKLTLEEGFYRLLGYIVAEATIGKDAVILSNMDKELLKDAGKTLKELDVPCYYTAHSLNICSRVFTNLLQAIDCTGKSKDKRVPGLVFEAAEFGQAAFLAGYFEGDGGVERSAVSATSKSKQLLGEISYLLYGAGIVGRITRTRKEAVGESWKGKRQYWRCMISGQDNLRAFTEKVGFVSERKQKSLARIIRGGGNTNVDLIPEVKKTFKELADLFGWQLHGIQAISDWKRGVKLPSRKSLKRVMQEIERRIERFKDLESSFGELGSMPELRQVVTAGTEDKELNRALWQELGQSWRVVKTGKCEPYCRNAFKIIRVINGVDYELQAVKQAVRQGLKEMNVTVKYQPGSLQSALVARPKSSPTYRVLQGTAQMVWKKYQQARHEVLPKVEELVKKLKFLAESDLFWDEIVQIKEIANKTDQYVYDLTVDNEVFLAGYGGMYVHNSYAVKLEILRQLMFDTEVIVIDPEQEYRYLADSVGGAYLRVATASDHRINPFDLPELSEDDEPETVLRENITRLVGLISMMAGGFSPEEQSIADRALWETYALKDITKDTRWARPNVPTLQDFYTIIKDMSGGQNIGLRIERFVEGTFSGVFNRPTNIDLDKQLVVFNVRDMEDELRPIAMYVVLGFIWNKVRSNLKRRILVVDEAWVMMQHEESAKFLFSMAKRARKYYLGVTTITQDIQDFLDSSYGKPIVTNSSLQLLLRQSPAAIDTLAEVFYLTDHEKFRLLESDVGEGIFFAGLKHVAIKVVASYAEDQVITSDPQQVLAIEAAKRELADEGS